MSHDNPENFYWKLKNDVVSYIRNVPTDTSANMIVTLELLKNTEKLGE